MRIIRIERHRASAGERISPWFGDSIGRWEGDTLVVETTNIHPMQLEQTSILWAYRGATENLKVTERFTRTGPDTILYRFTMDDPATFTAPFTGELPFNRIDEMIYEYACHEGNYAMTQHPVGRALQGARGGAAEEAAVGWYAQRCAAILKGSCTASPLSCLPSLIRRRRAGPGVV